MPSPVQPGGDRPWLIFVGAGIAALIIWSVQQDYRHKPQSAAETDVRPIATEAKANLPALFSADDYPLAALRRNEQGTVAFRLVIDRDGRVEECTIERSSGSRALDRATCQILERRARYTPARDGAGHAVADSHSGRIKWVLPDERMVAEEGLEPPTRGL